MKEFTKEQRARYDRQLNLKGVGPEGQKKLRDSKVFIIGAGGLGSPVAYYLTAAGVGHIGIADFDVVEVSNLHREILHNKEDVGKPKTISAKESMHAINPGIEVKTFNTKVAKDNIMELITGYDFVMDCTDGAENKYLINDACVSAGIPFCIGEVLEFHGQVTTVIPHESGCYRCQFKDEAAKESQPTCKEVGVMGSVAGIIGSIQATEAIKYITGVGSLLTEEMLTVDALTMDIKKTKRGERDKECPACEDNPTTCI